MRKALPQKNTLLKNAQANAESIFFKRVFFSPAQEEIQIIFFSTLRFFNYLFSQRTVTPLPDKTFKVNKIDKSECKLDNSPHRPDRRATDNSTLAIGGVSSPLDSFVVVESSVLRINLCARKPAHRQSAKRYA
jgi:hypothetical protein